MNLEARFPGVGVVGHLHGYVPDGIASAINAAAPDVVLVGMANPLQERWIDAHRASLHVAVVGVGALIDLLSGEIPRAPKIFRQARCEWLYRLGREPSRLFRRYVLGNPAFLVRSLLYTRFGLRRAASAIPAAASADATSSAEPRAAA